nr:MAG TPA: AT hook containing protein [Caudoviricetes sp.]
MRHYKHRDHDIVIHLADDHNVMLGDEYTEIDPENDDAGGADEPTSPSSSHTAPPASAPRRGRGRPRKSAK